MPEPVPEPLTSVFVVNGTRTGQGPGPGPKVLPASEAGALIGVKSAVCRDKPPATLLTRVGEVTDTPGSAFGS
jgi:hypothetical protein